jgi:disulfide bond formation protein DsbB
LDPFGGMSLDALHILTWIAPAVVALVAGFLLRRSFHWIALGAVLLFAALNAAAGIYVLNHFSEPRWSPEGSAPLSAPSLSETPMVGEFLVPLDSALEGVVGGVNDFRAFQQALPIALDFLATSGWALLVSFPLVILAACVSFAKARRRKAEFTKYRATVDSLKDELEQIKRQVAVRYPTHPARSVDAEDFRLTGPEP